MFDTDTIFLRKNICVENKEILVRLHREALISKAEINFAERKQNCAST
jgi:hypothetical protein